MKAIDELKIAAVDCFKHPTESMFLDEEEMLENIVNVVRNSRRPVTIIMRKVPGENLKVCASFDDK